MNKEYNFKISNREIGSGNPCFIIAEMSANHNQDFERAKQIIKTACECGADAVKLQTYTPDTLTIDCSKEWFLVKDSNPDWKGKTLYDLYKKAYMPWDWYAELKKIADNYKVILFSTAYDETAVDFLEKMNAPAYKIASFEITDIELLKKIAKTKKPVILSRGMSTLDELKEAVRVLKENGSSNICILHCVSSYPAKLEQMNLSTIPAIKKKFGVISGLSDHSLGITASVSSVVLGASVIERHFTLKRADGGVDATFSLEPEEFKQLVQSVREVEKIIGHIQLEPEKDEKGIIFRRSLFIVKDMKKGEEISRENVRCIRPSYGLAPKYLPEVLGKKIKKDIQKGTPLKWNLIS